MNMRMRGLLAVALIVVVSSPAVAESGPAGKLNQRIELDLLEAAPTDVFGSFAKMLGASLDLSPAVTGKITVRLHNVTADTAIGAVCESIGCRSELSWGESPVLRILPVALPAPEPVGPALRQSLDSPMSISLKDAAAMDVLVSISRMLKAELKIQEGTSQTVTLELQGVPASQALDAVGALLKMNWDLREEAVDGKTRRILEISPRRPVHPVSAAPSVDEKL